MLPITVNGARRASWKNHEKKGKKHYVNKKYKEAIVEFEKALELKEKPTLHFNLAQCYRLVGEDEKSLMHYKKFRKHIKTIKGLAIRRKLLIMEEVTSRIESLSMAINAKEAEKKRKEEEILQREEAIRKAKAQKEKKLLKKLTEKKVKTDPLTKQWWFWTGVSATAIFATGTVVFGLSALSENDEWESTGDTSFKDQAEKMQNWADISLSGAIIAGATTAIFTWLHLNKTPKKDETPSEKSNVSFLFNCTTRYCGINLGFNF
jgi:tetratricopeptide (TPR) repeat protein